MIRDVMNVWSM